MKFPLSIYLIQANSMLRRYLPKFNELLFASIFGVPQSFLSKSYLVITIINRYRLYLWLNLCYGVYML